MPTAEASLTINAPMEEIFDAFVDPEKSVQFSPGATLS